MSDLQAKFETASKEVQSLSKKPDNNALLQLYSLYKQGTAGDVTGKRPGFTDFVGKAKYDAWDKLKGTSKEKAMQDYINLVEKLKAECK
ncbi:MAG: acyl-CoA-binding protein [Desulfobacterales bacterium]|nr:acyl-CoA-binding protein [Desulfobacterales bacterium]MBF0397266.1 acyl-CoA-binding protein [Desulfobacterales bacterium]